MIMHTHTPKSPGFEDTYPTAPGDLAGATTASHFHDNSDYDDSAPEGAAVALAWGVLSVLVVIGLVSWASGMWQ